MNKKLIFGCVSIMMLAAGFTSCGDNNDDNGGETPTPTPQEEKYVKTQDGGLDAYNGILFTAGKDDVNGKEIGNGNQEFVFTGKRTIKKGVYTLKGWVYIAKGAELTIEPGTIIKGDKSTKASLIVEPGGKLIAKGSATAPIVFTSAQPKGSRKPGDWGGLVICGNAKNNKGDATIEGGLRTHHGGNNDADNSGILSYVRIEFAGYPFAKDQEINGLTFGSVGSGTQVDHIQVSYTNDDSYEWFGGSVNAKYLIAYHGWDDDFDTDNGFSGKVQFGLVVRNSRIADTSQSNGFESDNNSGGTDTPPYTNATFSNITFVGPKLDGAFQNNVDYINGGVMNPNNGSALGKFQSAMQIRRNSRLNCYNSVALGYPIGLILDNQKGDTQGAAKNGNLNLKNVWFAGMDAVGSDANKEYRDVLVTGYDANSKPIVDDTKKSFSSTWFLAQSGNKNYANISDLKFASNGYMPQAGSAVLTAALFTGLDAWFTQVPYIGAFKAGDNWLNGWTNFDPNNTDY